MRNWIRQRLGLTFALALSLVLALALAGIGMVVQHSLEDLGQAVSGESERAIRAQAVMLLARATQDEADHFNALLRGFETQAAVAAAQAAFLIEHAALHTADLPAGENLARRADGWFANSPQAPSQALYWGGVSLPADVEREIKALSHLAPLLESLRLGSPICRRAWVMGAAGFARLVPNPGDARPLLPLRDPREGPAFRLAGLGAGTGQGLRWTPLHQDAASGEPLVSVAAPVVSPKGEVLGVAGLDLALSNLGAYVFSQPHPAVTLGGGVARTRFEAEFSLLVSAEGDLLAVQDRNLARLGLPPREGQAESDRQAIMNLGGSDNSEVRRLSEIIRRGTGGSLGLTLEGQGWSVFHHPIPTTGWSLCLFAPDKELLASVIHTRGVIDRVVAGLRNQSALVTLAFLAVATVVVLVFFRLLLLRPIGRLQEGFAILAGGDLEARVDEDLPGELGRLAKAFNETARALKEQHQATVFADRRYREIFKNALNGFYQTDVHGQVIRVNPAMAHMFGYESASEMQARVRDFAAEHYVHPQDRERLLSLARERGEIRGQPIAFRRLDGSLLWGSVNARAVYDDQGELACVEGTVEDITQRRQAEEERLAMNQQLSAMNEQLSAMNEELSAANEEMASTNEELVQANDELVSEMARRRDTEERLRKARVAAEAASHAKSEFLANMSHEIRTPLNAVMGMLQLLTRSELSGEQREYADIALVSARSLLSVINDILDLSAVEAGKMVLQNETFEPARLVRQVTESFLGQAMNKGLRLEWSVDPGVPEILEGDPGRLRQVLFNLLGNAVKFTDRGGVRLDLDLLPVSPDKDRARLLIVVSDSGIGIAPDKTDYIFEPFTQADGSFRRKYQGTGLGLGIVKRIVGLMNGAICVDSEPGAGTTLYVTAEATLPGPGEALVRERRERIRTPGARLRVLVAEDSRINRILVVRVLEKLGHIATEAEDGLQALEILGREHFDLLLLDVQMPGLDGMEVTRAVRAGEAGVADSRIPIIAMTAHAMKGDREVFLQAGMDGYIAKPFDLDEFAEVLRDVLTNA